MKKRYTTDPTIIENLKKDTETIEKKYRSQQKNKRKKKAEKDDLSQKWLAPSLLIATLLIGWLISLIY